MNFRVLRADNTLTSFVQFPLPEKHPEALAMIRRTASPKGDKQPGKQGLGVQVFKQICKKCACVNKQRFKVWEGNTHQPCSQFPINLTSGKKLNNVEPLKLIPQLLWLFFPPTPDPLERAFKNISTAYFVFTDTCAFSNKPALPRNVGSWTRGRPKPSARCSPSNWNSQKESLGMSNPLPLGKPD